MKKNLYFLLAAVLLIPGILAFSPAVIGGDDEAQDSDADLILGNWRPSNGKSVIKMYKGVEANGEDPDKYYGKIVWLKEPNDDDGKPRTDIDNPKEELRDRPVKGLVIVKDLTFVEADGKMLYWGGDGTIYDPNNGSEYSFEAEINTKKENTLNGRGFIGVSLFGRTDTWTRLVRK